MSVHFTAADVLPTTDTYVISYAARTGVEVYFSDTLAALVIHARELTEHAESTGDGADAESAYDFAAEVLRLYRDDLIDIDRDIEVMHYRDRAQSVAMEARIYDGQSLIKMDGSDYVADDIAHRAVHLARDAYRWADRFKRDPFGMFARTYRDNAVRAMREASRLHDFIIGATFGPDGADSLLTFRSYMDQADRWIGR